VLKILKSKFHSYISRGKGSSKTNPTINIWKMKTRCLYRSIWRKLLTLAPLTNTHTIFFNPYPSWDFSRPRLCMILIKTWTNTNPEASKFKLINRFATIWTQIKSFKKRCCFISKIINYQIKNERFNFFL
jgi:hypothetical protein